MDNNIIKLCADAFAHRIDELHHEGRIEFYSGPGLVEEPITGMFYLIEDKYAAAEAAELAQRGQAARARFTVEGPWWAQPLPLHWKKCGKLAQIGELAEAGVFPPGNEKWELFSCFLTSWGASKWNPEHPSWTRFARGMMADGNTPARIRKNPELQKLYPRKRLEGLMTVRMAQVLAHSQAVEAAKAARRGT